MIWFLIVGIVCIILAITLIWASINVLVEELYGISALFSVIFLVIGIVCVVIYFAPAPPDCKLVEAHTEIVAGETILVSTSKCIKDGDVYEDVTIEMIDADVRE